MPTKSRMIFPSSPAPPPPSPIPTAKGSRSAADPFLSEYLDKTVQIPELTLPQHAHRFKPDELNFESLVLREQDSIRRLLRSVREFGVFRVYDHGIATEEMRFAFANTERIFGITVECCTSYGDHEKLVWGGDGGLSMEEAAVAAVGEQNYRILCHKMKSVTIKLETIAEELANIIVGNQIQEPIQLGESTLNIYRYHRANIIDRKYSSIIEEMSQETCPYILSLHLMLESSEFCIESDKGNLSFDTNSGIIVVTIGKNFQEWSLGKFKSVQGKLNFKPFLHTNRPSFSIEQKWSVSNSNDVVSESNKIVSLVDQILILLFITLICKFYAYLSSWGLMN